MPVFSRFKPRSHNLPDLTPEMLHAAGETIDWCLEQIGAFMGVPVRPCPEFGHLHDERIGSYAAGFLTGYIQVTGADRRWAGSDRGLMDAGVLVLCASALTAIIGPERGVYVFDRIPLVRGLSAPQDLHRIYRAGGGDGIAHAKAQEKQFGGRLLHYLMNNVELATATHAPVNSEAVTIKEKLKENHNSSPQDGSNYVQISTSTQAQNIDTPLSILDDLGARIEAARARQLKQT